MGVKLQKLMGLGIRRKSINKFGAPFVKSKASTHPQEENVIDPAKGELHLVEHEIGNKFDQALQTKDLKIERLKHEVEELREIIKEANARPKTQKLTHFGDLILYLLIVIIISFIMIGFKEPTAMY